MTRVDADPAVRRIYDKARSMGADALTHFEVEAIPAPPAGLDIRGIRVTGFAIKRRSP